MKDLTFVYDGWQGYHHSLVEAIRPLSNEQLEWRARPEMSSVREIAWHIASGRVEWFSRMEAPGSAALAEEVLARMKEESIPFDAEELVDWLERSWKMVDATLRQWSVDDLEVGFHHPYQGKTYAVSRQWVVWRIMAHDIHHGGQLSELLGAHGVEPLELTLLGGHLTEPPVVES
jgi:uncharacterized damage-inducible protein DinB